ncbi:protein CrcB [Gleimia coleocanis DSM 15436]|uniref:Fluoride-specific ion channel FluC n=1 Tax=Gleimia coleocanis DSM 15436 TaxID=525245 RepID=C0W065_9ACTO|nr:fluoride efflux transporter CrcB [Gleimia coleocanis]EEH63924.1 protein CrcB [Gleimia coleocanis DSM 15436]
MFINALAVGAGGFIGAALRYLISVSIPYRGGFPWATFGINMLGTFLLAFFAQVLVVRWGLGETASLALRVGLCGGFTTFSTFSLETLTLVENGQWGTAVIYVTVSIIFGLVAAIAGSYIGQ